jgi:hypothetical protein
MKRLITKISLITAMCVTAAAATTMTAPESSAQAASAPETWTLVLDGKSELATLPGMSMDACSLAAQSLAKDWFVTCVDIATGAVIRP